MINIVIIGLGYVGLPLAVEFGRKYNTIGFDINTDRIQELEAGIDNTLEVETEELKKSKMLSFTSDINEIRKANYYIVTVPTPIDNHKKPDLTPLESASKSVAKVLMKGDVVIYESTVYPGCTEEVCVPILEEISGLEFNKDFFCGYSPERINPGDKVHRLPTIVKVTSGSTPEVADKVDSLYKQIITAGTHKASSIRVAEAAKVIENSQRDLNIAFVNELALIFDRMNIDTHEVLEAAGTKWNFLPFNPGLVGGHCIGVDPYYLTYKAESLDYRPEVILSGRRINDNMGSYIANSIIKLMCKKGTKINGGRALVLGLTFKENCPDLRNSKVIDIITELSDFGLDVEITDPHASSEEALREYDVSLAKDIKGKYDVVVGAVAHNEFKNLSLSNHCHDETVIFDVKGFLDRSLVDKRL